MTGPADFDPLDAVLPGLSPATDHSEGSAERAARQTITALSEVLDARHAVMCEALLISAQQLDIARRSSKAKEYAIANLLAQMREIYLVLTTDQEGGDGDAWNELVAEFRRRPAEVRDQA